MISTSFATGALPFPYFIVILQVGGIIGSNSINLRVAIALIPRYIARRYRFPSAVLDSTSIGNVVVYVMRDYYRASTKRRKFNEKCLIPKSTRYPEFIPQAFSYVKCQ